MKRLVARIAAEGISLGGGILKVDGFINRRLEPDLTLELGHAFAKRFAAPGITNISKIVTAEVSGIAPAFATGVAPKAPVVYARKKRPLTMPDALAGHAPSRTKAASPHFTAHRNTSGQATRCCLSTTFWPQAEPFWRSPN